MAVKSGTHPVEVLVFWTEPQDFISWPGPQKRVHYERVLAWHDYVDDLNNHGFMPWIWGTHSLLDSACFQPTQDLEVGDLIPMFHETHGLAIAYRVDSFQASEWMLWVHSPHENERPDSTWSWQLLRLPNDNTRLITRMKQDYRWQTPRLAMFNLILMEFGDFAMERRMLKGIKARAERMKATA